jgi:hypothetical protein
METVLQPTASPFPALFQRYANDPKLFLEIAWITCGFRGMAISVPN